MKDGEVKRQTEKLVECYRSGKVEAPRRPETLRVRDSAEEAVLLKVRNGDVGQNNNQ